VLFGKLKETARKPLKKQVLIVATIFIFFVISLPLIFQSRFASEKSMAISHNEVVTLSNPNPFINEKIYKVNFSFPSDTPNSKLLEFGNSNESVSIFKLKNRAMLVFSGLTKENKTFVTDSLSVPLQSNGSDYSLIMTFDDSRGILDLQTSSLSFSWELPSEIGFTQVEYLSIENLPSLNTQLLLNTSLHSTNLIILILLIQGAIALIAIRKTALNFFRKLFLEKGFFILRRSKLNLALLVIAVFGLMLLPPAPPAGVLTSASVDLSKVELSDLTLENGKIGGGWLFDNSPETVHGSKNYISTLKFEMDVFLDPELDDIELLAYGTPSGKNSSPISKKNFGLVFNSQSGLSYKLPDENHGQSIFRSGKLNPGIHRITGEIRNGREFEFSIDNKLVYAMSRNVPSLLTQEPNLFVSDSLLENIESGSVSWNVRSEVQAPFKYAIDRILTVLLSLMLFFSLTNLIISGISGGNRIDAEPSSRKILVLASRTFLGLSMLGILLWLVKLQPSHDLFPPRNTPLFVNDFRFSDFFQIFISAQNSDPYEIANASYPPFGLLLLDTFGFLSGRQALIILMAGSMALITAVAWKMLSLRNDLHQRERFLFLSPILLAFPVVFSIDRGNIDLIVVALLALAFWLTIQPRSYKSSGILLGIACSLKIYPLFLLPIFYFVRRDPRMAAWTVFTFISSSIAGMKWFKLSPSEILDTVLIGSADQNKSGDDYTRWNGSLGSLTATLLRLFASSYESFGMSIVSSLTFTLALLFFGAIISWRLLVLKTPIVLVIVVWISTVSLAFPVTPSYRLSMFILVFLALISLGSEGVNDVKSLGVALGVIVSPAVYWYFGNGFTSTYSIIIPVALISAIIICLRSAVHLHRQQDHQIKDFSLDLSH
jgi:hypothetical protein